MNLLLCFEMSMALIYCSKIFTYELVIQKLWFTMQVRLLDIKAENNEKA